MCDLSDESCKYSEVLNIFRKFFYCETFFFPFAIKKQKLISALLRKMLFIIFSNRQFLSFLSLFFYRMRIHKNGNASEVLKSISTLDNSNKQC